MLGNNSLLTNDESKAFFTSDGAIERRTGGYPEWTIPPIVPGNEREYECLGCKDSGWRGIDLPGRSGMRKCECSIEKARARYLALIPERFKDRSFESFEPRDLKQGRALSLMRKDPGGSWYLTGAYGNSKTHLLYAQCREIVISGKVHCHVRTTRDLVEELRRAEFDEDFASPVIAAASKREPVW